MTGMRQGESLRRFAVQRMAAEREKQKLGPLPAKQKPQAHECKCGKMISANKDACKGCGDATT